MVVYCSNLLSSRCFSSSSVVIKGWVQTVRIHKNVAFLQMHDGYSSMQIVVDRPSLAKNIHTGSSVEVCGILKTLAPCKSEVHASSISVIGASPPQVSVLGFRHFCPYFDYIALRCIVLRCVALRYVVLYYAALRCVALRCVALRCISLCIYLLGLSSSKENTYKRVFEIHTSSSMQEF